MSTPQENKAKYEELREKYPLFVYESYHYSSNKEGIDIRFCFKIYDKDKKEAFCFTPTLFIPFRSFYRFEKLEKAQWDRLLFHCGLVELISYWKCVCSPKVEVRCGFLDQNQIRWFQNLYYQGLGEFFYLNGIPATPQDFMSLHSVSIAQTEADPPLSYDLSGKVIIPVGGGKDSVVTLEIIRSVADCKGFALPMIINPRGATKACCRVAGYEPMDILVMNRSIDPLLLKLNEEGFLNGHTPFSAMLAFSSLLLAALIGRKYIALSNESSANESTVQGTQVNHQYSKTYSFETDFRNYTRQYISPDFEYFSFLRPLSEIGIARLFASYPAYHNVFRSCNVGSKQDTWCGHCPKCLFAYIILSVFIVPEKMEEIFGKNLLNDPTLKTILDELIGQLPVKPFECVGTTEEVNWALQQWIQKYGLSEGSPLKYPKPYLITYYQSLSLSQKKIPNSILNDFNAQHHLSPYFVSLLKETLYSKEICHAEERA
ncbi:MAG: hypothetical protein RRX93_04465 [Bacteroidales bacterium]